MRAPSSMENFNKLFKITLWARMPKVTT